MKIATLALALAAAAAAQTPAEPPPLLQLTRIPNGAKVSRPYQRAKVDIDVIGLASMTGVPESWLIEPHQSFAGIEQLDAALRAVAPSGPANEFGEAQPDDLLGAPRSIIAVYDAKSSYHPGEAIRNLPKSRYFRISVYRGGGSDPFMDAIARARRSSYDDVNLDRAELTYRVVSGAPAGTYFVLSPLTSLHQIDEGIQRLPGYVEPTADMGFGDREISREHLIFRIDPRLSYVSAAFAGEDSAFWNPQRQ